MRAPPDSSKADGAPAGRAVAEKVVQDKQPSRSELPTVAQGTSSHADAIVAPGTSDAEQLLDDLILLWRHRRVLEHRLAMLQLRYEFDLLAVLEGEEHDQLAAEIASFNEICRALADSVGLPRAKIGLDSEAA
jgi:hypothetical protein